MNLYAIVAAGLLWGASLTATGYWFYGAGQDHCEAQSAREERLVSQASDAAASSVASAIAMIKVTNKTVKQTLEKEVREKTIYRDCRSSDDAVRLLNQTTGASSAASVPVGSQLPGSAPAH